MELTNIRAINLTHKSIEAFDDFLGLIEVPRFRRNLRNVFLYYMTNERSELPADYNEFIEDIKYAFDFLDTIEDELKGKGI